MLRHRPPRLRLSRKAAVALVLMAALFGVSHGASPHGQHGTAAGHGQPIAATVLAATTPAAGGPCSVPGIGDIGGLLGFCSIGSSGTLLGGLNGLCAPGVPQPESATTGVDSLISPPAPTGKPAATPYNQYGMSGQYWAATDLQCSDMTSLIGNDVAGMLFDFAKAMDRVTITVYQSAAGEGILGWLQGVTDRLVTGLGNAIYFPYVAVVVILAAIWLAWQGLIRKRGTRTIEGTIWMIVACAAAVWLIGRPADFTGLGKGVSDGISTTLNAAFAHLPSPGDASCLPVKGHDPQISPASFSYTSSRTVVDQNANELWTVLVCKPWVDGEFGTTAFSSNGKATPVAGYARSLLWAQAIAANERPTTTLITAKQDAYTGIAQTIKSKDPSVYPLFQGKEWTTRLEIAFAALLAALVAGVLVLLISVTLILLKLGFLLLLIVGPFFLLIGTHPGFGRVVAVRWFEMLVGVLLKQAAVALALSVLLYCYALIMGTADSVLPWALKILMITLVTVAVFIYRKPFQHLFASVGYGAIGSSDRAEADLAKAAATARANTRTAATIAVPGFAAYRAARWARQNPSQAAGLALGAVTAASTSALAASAAAGMDGSGGSAGGDYNGGGMASGGGGSGPHDSSGPGPQPGVGARARAWGASPGTAPGSQAPPLKLPPRQGASAGWANGGSSSRAASPASPARPAGQGGPAGGTGGQAAAPPPLVRSAGGVASGGPASGRSGPAASVSRPAWSSGGSSARPGRPAAPRAGSGQVGGASQAGTGQAGTGQAGGAGRVPRRAAVDRAASDAGTDRAPRPGRQPRPSRLAGQGRPEAKGGRARPSRPAGGQGRGSGGSPGSNGDLSATPYGLGPGGEDSPGGPFWSRPVWRRK